MEFKREHHFLNKHKVIQPFRNSNLNHNMRTKSDLNLLLKKEKVLQSIPIYWVKVHVDNWTMSDMRRPVPCLRSLYNCKVVG